MYADVRSGKKKLSVEAVASDARCSECGETFKSPLEYCAHLNSRPSNGATRWLSGLKAIGGGTVPVPAATNPVFDQNRFTLLAALGETHGEVETEGVCDDEDETDTEEKDDEMNEQELQAALEKIAGLEAQVATHAEVLAKVSELETKLAEANAKLVTQEAQLATAALVTARSIELLAAGFGAEQVKGLSEKLAGTDEDVYQLLLSTQKEKRDTILASMTTIVAEPDKTTEKPKEHTVLAGGTVTPQMPPDQWAVFKLFRTANATPMSKQ